MLKQKETKQLEIINDAIHDLCFLLHSFKSPAKWDSGVEPEMPTWGLHVSKPLNQVQKRVKVYVMLSYRRYTASTLCWPFLPLFSGLALVLALLWIALSM